MKFKKKTKLQIKWIITSCIFKSSTLFCLSFSIPITAQIVPDTTLPNDSIIRTQGNINIINEGTRAGNNLFHSFEQFSVFTGHTAYFNNASDIQNIISRVTGKSVSNIDGLIQANGAANFFLFNPNGIIFGPNTRLDIGGSFLASTAGSLRFSDGREFNATTPKTATLLTISVPIGLSLDNNPGDIRVQGSGHDLAISSLYSPISGAGSNPNGLRVLPGKTLALIGGNIALEGGNLTAPGGRVELGSVSHGTVSINPATSGWMFGYQGLQNFQNIELSKRALVDASGSGNSAIQLVGKQIFLNDGSVALIQNQGTQAGSGINIQASNLLQLSGTSSDGMIPSGVEVESLGGIVGDVVLSTKILSFEDGAAINSKTFTEASASNIVLNASESIEVKGFSSINPTNASIASGVGSYTFGTGTSGKIVINTENLTALNGGTIISGTFGTGMGGDLIVNATRRVELSGFNPVLSSPSQLAVIAYSSGNSGDLRITSPEIKLYSRGSIASYTFSSGNAGKVSIEASDFIDITTPTNIEDLSYNFLSGISSYAIFPAPVKEILGLPSQLSGAAGSINIKTGQLSLSKGSITVSNLGIGSAGNVDINANIISLQNNSSISAATALGNGGNISLHANHIQLLGDTSMSASAGNPQMVYRILGINIPYNFAPTGIGNGGNITVNTSTLVAQENSDITANAFQGQGGNIQINGKLLIRSPDSDFTASSELGFDGTVEINVQDRNPSRVKVQPEAIAQTPKVASVCQGRSSGVASTFINVGTGGLLGSSKKQLYSSPGWQENSIVDESVESVERWELTNSQVNEQPTKIVEAQGWIRNSKGDVVLIAEANSINPDASLSARSCSTAG